MSNAFDDVQCQFEVISNSAVAFFVDLTVYPKFHEPAYVVDNLNRLMARHPGARTAECHVKGELLTIIVHGTVNPVTATRVREANND